MEKKSKLLLIRFLIIFLVGSYFLGILTYGTSTFADSLRGYEEMFQFMEGGNWNSLSYPSVYEPEFSYYVAWWSPGQWVFPFLIFDLFGISSIQTIQFILIAVCLILSLFGYNLLFKKFGFSSFISAFSLLCIASNQLFYWHTFLYFGGDLFLLAFFPYFLLFLLHYKENITFTTTILFILLCLFGVFLKNTWLVIALCSSSFIFFSQKTDSILNRIKNTLPIITSFCVLYFLVNKFHLSLGETPTSSHDYEGYLGVKNNFIGDISYSLGSPMGIFTRFTFIVQKLPLNYFSNSVFSTILQVIPLLLTGLFILKFPKKKYSTYFNILLYFCIPFLLFFVFVYLQDNSVSYEMRHFAPISFLFFPGLIVWLTSNKYKLLMVTAITLFCVFDLGLYAISSKKIEETHSFWNQLKLPNEDVKLLSAIEKWDKSYKNGIVIIEDYWLPCIGVRKNEKVVLKQKNNLLYIVSGMEIEHPDNFNIYTHKMENYSSVLLVKSLAKKQSLQLKLDFQFNSILKTDKYEVFQSIN